MEAAVDGPVTVTLMSSSLGTWVGSENLCKVDTRSPASLSAGPRPRLICMMLVSRHSLALLCTFIPGPGPPYTPETRALKSRPVITNGENNRDIVWSKFSIAGMHSAADLIINFVHLKLKVQVVFIVSMCYCDSSSWHGGVTIAGHDQSLSRRSRDL